MSTTTLRENDYEDIAADVRGNAALLIRLADAESRSKPDGLPPARLDADSWRAIRRMMLETHEGIEQLEAIIHKKNRDLRASAGGAR